MSELPNACSVKEQAEAVEYKLGLKRKLRIFAEDTQRRLPQVSPASSTPLYKAVSVPNKVGWQSLLSAGPKLSQRACLSVRTVVLRPLLMLCFMVC